MAGVIQETEANGFSVVVAVKMKKGWENLELLRCWKSSFSPVSITLTKVNEREPNYSLQIALLEGWAAIVPQNKAI